MLSEGKYSVKSVRVVTLFTLENREIRGGERGGRYRGSRREGERGKREEEEFVCLVGWFLNVLVNY